MVAQAIGDDPDLFKTFLFHAYHGVGVELLLQENSLENYLRLAETKVSGISAEWKHSSAQSSAGLQSLADHKHRPVGRFRKSWIHFPDGIAVHVMRVVEQPKRDKSAENHVEGEKKDIVDDQDKNHS